MAGGTHGEGLWRGLLRQRWPEWRVEEENEGGLSGEWRKRVKVARVESGGWRRRVKVA